VENQASSMIIRKSTLIVKNNAKIDDIYKREKKVSCFISDPFRQSVKELTEKS